MEDLANLSQASWDPTVLPVWPGHGTMDVQLFPELNVCEMDMMEVSTTSSSDHLADDHPLGARLGYRERRNVGERRRRTNMRTCLHALQGEVPNLMGKPSSKIKILNEASSYIRKLMDERVRLKKATGLERDRHSVLLSTMAAMNDRLCS